MLTKRLILTNFMSYYREMENSESDGDTTKAERDLKRHEESTNKGTGGMLKIMSMFYSYISCKSYYVYCSYI